MPQRRSYILAWFIGGALAACGEPPTAAPPTTTFGAITIAFHGYQLQAVLKPTPRMH